jgi:hypothetical protein
MRFTLASLLVAGVCVFLAPAAQASDASLKRVVATQGEKFEKAIDRFDDRVDEIETDAQLERAKTETERLAKVTGTFHTKVKGEQADSSKYKRARTKLLDALSTYKRGLNQLADGIEDKSKSKIETARKTLESSGKKFVAAAKAFS